MSRTVPARDAAARVTSARPYRPRATAYSRSSSTWLARAERCAIRRSAAPSQRQRANTRCTQPSSTRPHAPPRVGPVGGDGHSRRRAQGKARSHPPSLVAPRGPRMAPLCHGRRAREPLVDRDDEAGDLGEMRTAPSALPSCSIDAAAISSRHRSGGPDECSSGCRIAGSERRIGGRCAPSVAALRTATSRTRRERLSRPTGRRAATSRSRTSTAREPLVDRDHEAGELRHV